MRLYEKNSAEASARVVILALLSDGDLSSHELSALQRIGAYRRLGLSHKAFMRVLRDTCIDLEIKGYAKPDGYCADRAVLRASFADITLPLLQRDLALLVIEALEIDCVVQPEEVFFFEAALDYWGLDIQDWANLPWHNNGTALPSLKQQQQAAS